MLPVFNQGLAAPVVAAGLIFVAYEGFELIPNAIQEMRHPETDLKRGLILAILITSAIYVVVSLVALGNLTPEQVAKDQEYVLAVAARPTLGEAGFVLIGIAALMSTASAINATLFGSARLAMVMAAEHALPRVFSMRERTRDVPWVSLVVLSVLTGVVPAARRPHRHLVLRQRRVPGDLRGGQPVRLAAARPHRDSARGAARRRAVLARRACRAPLAHLAGRPHQPGLDRRLLPRRDPA